MIALSQKGGIVTDLTARIGWLSDSLCVKEIKWQDLQTMEITERLLNTENMRLSFLRL